MYAQPLGPNDYDLTSLTPFRAKRFQQSIGNNQYFFNGPFTGVFVQLAAYNFIYRFMSNKLAEYPDGYHDGEVLRSFFSMTEAASNGPKDIRGFLTIGTSPPLVTNTLFFTLIAIFLLQLSSTHSFSPSEVTLVRSILSLVWMWKI